MSDRDGAADEGPPAEDAALADGPGRVSGRRSDPTSVGVETGSAPDEPREPDEPDDQAAPEAAARGPLTDVAIVLGSFLVLGVLCGVVWWLLVDPAVFTKQRTGGSMGEVQLGRRFDADGWYVVIAVVTGLVAGTVLTWLRWRDPLLTTALVAVGSVVAAVAMAWTGHLLGPGDPNAVLAHAAVGTRVPVQLAVGASASYLAWPIGALIGALVVLWSSPRTVDS
jgi:hypothetical protein